MTQPEDAELASLMEAEQLITDTEQLEIEERVTTADVSACADEQAPLADRLAVVSIPITTDVPDSATGTTAFFVFSSVHRQQVRDALQRHIQGSQKLGIGQIGKKIGMQTCHLHVQLLNSVMKC